MTSANPSMSIPPGKMANSSAMIRWRARDRGRRMFKVLDLFAGPGGWDIAGETLAMNILGVELDPTACATRRAAGLLTVQGDVSLLEPAMFAPVWGLIASPPCQAFSMAGNGAGRAAIAGYVAAIADMADITDPQLELLSSPAAAINDACDDPRAHLVLEPLRWALALKPTWIALEQVPPVLPIWEAMAIALERHGYSCWTGLVTAEQYGVPQTRERAILTAHREHAATRPPPTHQRYVAPRRRKATALFDAGHTERIVHPADRGLLPWVSMADALGWPPHWSVTAERGATNATERSVDEPAPTLLFGHHRNSGVEWVHERPATTVNGDPRISEPGHHDSDVSGSQQANNVRVTLNEAAALQTFPAGYPWQGSKTAAFQQVGDAVPPLLAHAILKSLIDERQHEYSDGSTLGKENLT